KTYVSSASAGGASSFLDLATGTREDAFEYPLGVDFPTLESGTVGAVLSKIPIDRFDRQHRGTAAALFNGDDQHQLSVPPLGTLIISNRNTRLGAFSAFMDDTMTDQSFLSLQEVKLVVGVEIGASGDIKFKFRSSDIF
ncbi:unnamed protein product, partial [Amoebophrya sp. A25]